MCRLFGLRAGRRVVTATFWLLQAPDNLVEQSRRNPDGTGIGVFGADGTPVLYMLDRRDVSDKHLRMDSHRITAHSEHLADHPSIVFASEPMDDDAWQLHAPGELVHVDADLRLTRRIAFPDPPKHQLRHEDLTAQAASSQHASVAQSVTGFGRRDSAARIRKSDAANFSLRIPAAPCRRAWDRI